jgi:hypothetical protein
VLDSDSVGFLLTRGSGCQSHGVSHSRLGGPCRRLPREGDQCHQGGC